MSEVTGPHGAHRGSVRTAIPAAGNCGRSVLLGLVLAVVAIGWAAAAQASSGGVRSSSSGGASPNGPAIPFGARVLRLGMQGSDVAVLNGIVKSKPYGVRVRFGDQFTDPTASAVRDFQRKERLGVSGVVTRQTAEQLTGSMRHSGATWYGPGFYGRRTACGQVLRRGTIGVAHKTLPCGTLVTFYYHGHAAIARVIDRGPFTKGNSWDLSNGLRRALAFNGSDQIRYAVAR